MSKQTFFSLLLRAFIFTFLMLLIWVGLNTYMSGTFWEGMTISKSALKVEYCEFNHPEKFFHQPMNTYSNLFYFFFGILILLISREDALSQGINANRLAAFPLLSALMGFCFIYLSFGSAFFHASLTWMGQRVDMNGTYGVSLTLVGIGLYHVFHKITFSKRPKILYAIALCILIGSFYPIALMVSSSILLPFLILLLLILIGINYVQFRKERSIILAILSFACIVVALKIRTLDVQKIGCDPFSLYQGHALWHFLTATSSFCSYAFFRFHKPF